MTLKGLLVFFEEFYGEKYIGVFSDTMMTYLHGYSDNFYNAAAEVLVKRFSRTYNKVPGPAEFEKHMDEILKAMPAPKELPEPEIQLGTQEEQEKFIDDMKKLMNIKSATGQKFLMQEGENYCYRTEDELVELRKNGNYHGAVINRR
jgi:hypothetical protein